MDMKEIESLIFFLSFVSYNVYFGVSANALKIKSLFASVIACLGKSFTENPLILKLFCGFVTRLF